MHKGYTLSYFIRFFNQIPASQFTTNCLINCSNLKMDALGHAASLNKMKDIYTALTPKECLLCGLPKACSNDVVGTPAQVRATALDRFLSGETTKINDGVGEYKQLGNSPKARIIRALKMRKHHGKCWTDQL